MTFYHDFWRRLIQIIYKMKTKFSGILTLLLALVVQLSFAQQKTVTGTVNDDAGLPLPGANVIVKGTSNGTQTDFDGNYSINVNQGQTLVFSYVGFSDQSKTVGTSNVINVKMEAGEGLDEVIVVAYGTQSKETVSSAISVINPEQIEQVPIASLDQLFQGQAAGLNVQTSSGQPGASGTILIRGRSSINGQTEPLFVIDGIPVDEDTFRNINANDIATVSILKDASASALYGNRAAGGVVIITTKQGKFESAPEMTYRSLYGISENINPNFEVLNARQYLTLQRDNGINNVSLGNLGNLSDAEFEQLINDSADTRWEDIFFRQARTNTQELVWSSGSDKATTFNSLQYFEQEGITLRSRLQRFSFRSNNSLKVNDKFSIDTQFNASFSTSEFTEDEGTGQLDNPFLIAYLARPEVSAFNDDGTLDLVGDGTTGFSNLPAVGLSSNALDINEDNELRLIGSVNFKYDLLKNVSVGLRTGVDFRSIRDRVIINPLSLRGVNDNNGGPGIGEFKGAQTETTAIDFTSVTTANITYANTFGDKHNVEVSAFQEYFKRHTEFNGFTGFGLDPRLIGSGNGIQPGTAAEGDDLDQFPYIANVFASSQDLGTLSYFAIARYDYDNNFGFQANIRRDGTSRFSEENRWGTFGAVSAFWNLHKNILSESNFINELKLRASYGTVGSQEISGAALLGLNIASPLFGLGTGYQGQTSIFVNSLGNPNAKWETTIQRNIGIDFTLAKNRVSGSIDAYRNTTSDLFADLFQSGVTSVFNFDGNFGELQNQGLELQLNVNLIENENFSWNVFGNVGYNVNEVLELELAPGQTEQVLGQTALAEGQPIRSFFLVEWAGVNPANGEPLYRDINGDITNVFDEANRQFSDKTSDPLFQGGFGTSVKYKGFYTDVNFSYAADQWRNNGSFGVIEGGGNGILAFSNGSIGLLDAWQNVGDVTSIPALAQNNTRLQTDTRFLEDASFLRLRNMTIGHKFNLQKSKVLQTLNVYVRGVNLLTFTKWRGYDPESNLAGTFFEFPTPRTYSFGIEAKF